MTAFTECTRDTNVADNVLQPCPECGHHPSSHVAGWVRHGRTMPSCAACHLLACAERPQVDQGATLTACCPRCGLPVPVAAAVQSVALEHGRLVVYAHLDSPQHECPDPSRDG